MPFSAVLPMERRSSPTTTAMATTTAFHYFYILNTIKRKTNKKCAATGGHNGSSSSNKQKLRQCRWRTNGYNGSVCVCVADPHSSRSLIPSRCCSFNECVAISRPPPRQLPADGWTDRETDKLWLRRVVHRISLLRLWFVSPFVCPSLGFVCSIVCWRIFFSDTIREKNNNKNRTTKKEDNEKRCRRLRRRRQHKQKRVFSQL